MKSETENRIRYEALDGIRAYSAIGIVLMHVLANGDYGLTGFVFEQMIPSFANLVFLFMIVSGFSMCSGYFDKIIGNQISISEFYEKRYAKIWPFFATLCVLDFVLFPSINSAYEVFANLTLCFGLLPNADISVIGVGWFLGLVFVFYLIFPFFCYLISDKKRAWLSFTVALVFNHLCSVRFGVGRANIVYSAVFFLTGGLVFLYKEKLEEVVDKYRWLILISITGMTIIYYTVSNGVPVMLVLFSVMLVYGLLNAEKACILYNPFTKFLSSISMEVYLSHMVIFRTIEKIGLTKAFPFDLLSYIMTTVGTIIGTIAFSLIVKGSLKYVSKYLKNREHF